MPPPDRDWLEGALKAWPEVQRRYLKGPPRGWPTVIVYDASCRYTLAARQGPLTVVQTVRYSGGVPLPTGARMPPGPHALFTETPGGERTVLMALPSVWQAAPHPKRVPLLWVLEGALFHELTHAYQAAAAPSASFRTLRRQGLRPTTSLDDGIQAIYAADPSYAGLVSYERMLLASATSATDTTEARDKACEAAKAMHERRRRLAAKAPSLPELDEVANTSEGLGNWVAWRWLTEDRKVAPDDAAAVLGGRSWSQAIGLALFRAIDRVSPGWEARLLSDPPTTGLGLLEEACGPTSR